MNSPHNLRQMREVKEKQRWKESKKTSKKRGGKKRVSQSMKHRNRQELLVFFEGAYKENTKKRSNQRKNQKKSKGIIEENKKN